MIRVEVLDSSPIYLCGLTHSLPKHDIEIVSLHRSPHNSLPLTADVCLLDAYTLEILGPGATSYVTRAARRCRVLILTPRHGFPVGAYLAMGAAGAVSKQEDATALAQAIRVATCPAADVPAPRAGEATRADDVLSGREKQVLHYIASGYTHGQAARRLGISTHTVDTYVKRIRTKLEVGNKAELTRAAMLGRHMPWPT
jgi:DNA-binding NarL/FixJ family response regulator